MNKQIEVLLTTTSTIQDEKVEKYLGIISAQLVAGTGLFSEFMAGFSDIVGGRSRTFQKQLEALNTEVLEMLKVKAVSINANAVLGVRIDYDEISGKNLQMFMVTASGTAVKMETKTELRSELEISGELVSKENLSQKIHDLIFENAIQEALENGNLRFTSKVWDYVIKKKMEQVLPSIYDVIKNEKNQRAYLGDSLNPYVEFINKSCEFFAALPRKKAIDVLFDWYSEEDLIQDYALEIIEKNNLVSLEKAYETISSEDYDNCKNGLIQFKFIQPYYEKGDIQKLENLKKLILEKFPPKEKEFYKELDRLTRVEKKYWKCECGTLNEPDKQYCYSCKKDVDGFTKNQLNPKEALNIISIEIEVLSKAFL